VTYDFIIQGARHFIFIKMAGQNSGLTVTEFIESLVKRIDLFFFWLFSRVVVLLIISLYLLIFLLVNPFYLFVLAICSLCWLVRFVVCFSYSVFRFVANRSSVIGIATDYGLDD
jgi:uncharacterized membrane protein YqjE